MCPTFSGEFRSGGGRVMAHVFYRLQTAVAKQALMLVQVFRSGVSTRMAEVYGLLLWIRTAGFFRDVLHCGCICAFWNFRYFRE